MKDEIAGFEEWMDRNSRAIERFAFQYGCSPEQAAQMAEETFRDLYQDVEKREEGKLAVYKVALEKLRHIEQLNPMLVSPFTFEEDADFHSKIIMLAENARVPLTLHVFHGCSIEEIAEMMTLPVGEVESTIQAAKELLRGAIGNPSVDIVEKRFEFLGKSYDRLPILFHADNVHRQEYAPIVKERKKFGRRGWVTAIILGVLLVGLVGSTYFTSEDWELRSDRKYIEGLEKEFAESVSVKQEILGVSDDVFGRIHFIQIAQERFKDILIELEDKNQEGKKIDRQLAEAWMLELTEAMKLPSELADELFAAPLVDDAAQSMMFAEVYLMKVDGVRYSLYELYANDYDKLREALRTGTFDAEAIASQQDVYSEETIEAIQALSSQNIDRYLEDVVVMRNEDSEFIAKLRAALHESAGSSLTEYEKAPFLLGDQLFYSLDETIELIEEMERTVVAARRNGWMGHSMERTMLSLLDAMLQGRTIEEFKSSDGSITDVHRSAWKQLASLGPDSGVGVIMTRIVEEMEVSGWKHSEFRDSMGNWQINEAYSFAVNGDLERYEEQPFAGMYDQMTYSLPNSQLDSEVADLYDEFSIAYDRNLLKNVNPLVIIGLFYYANDKENPAVMWHLTDPASRVSSLQDFKSKEIALLDITDAISYDSSMLMDDGSTRTVPIEFERNGKMYYNVWMTYAEDNVWQLESIVIEEGSL
ncbi:RNA polymerase sigma factor [Sporosarcina sp. NPDC096371]|uniref:RNA polymerase sigma factor n=1 Tax=Sporosarcina sp. NPDC096371 TaxID=3364530 RepID=UPI0037F94544